MTKELDGLAWLVGDWDASGEMAIEGETIRISGHTTIEALGPYVVLRSTIQPAEFPDSISVIGGGSGSGAAPMHYFDERGVERRYESTVDGKTWTIVLTDEHWRESPGFRQRYVGEISSDDTEIRGTWQRATDDAGTRWEVDFRLDYRRTG